MIDYDDQGNEIPVCGASGEDVYLSDHLPVTHVPCNVIDDIEY